VRFVKFLWCTLPSIPENLALDEALLETADQATPDSTAGVGETLRLWEARSPFVVLGRSSKFASEVKLATAHEMHVPVYRRVSGGTSVVAAPGCMFYAVLIDLEHRPHLRMLDAAHDYVMSRMSRGLQVLEPRVSWTGTCDLVVGDRKVGGNSLRIGRRWMLYHGTLLLDMELEWLERLLQHPPREPEYRAGRSHLDFVTNLKLAPQQVAEQLRKTWQAEAPFTDLPTDAVQRLVMERYSCDSWNRQR
jgi:lipoate---protein ligase